MSKVKRKFNKMTIAVIALSVALIAAIGGIFGVYAATQQNVTTMFSVGYTIGDNVAVAIGACYVPGDASETTWFTLSGMSLTKQENNLYTINASEINDMPNLVGDDFTYSGTGYDEVRFYFENISDQVISVAYTVSLFGVGSSSYKYIDGQHFGFPDGTNMQYIQCGGVVSSTTERASYTSDAMELRNYQIYPGEIYCITFAIKPIDLNKSAMFDVSGDTKFWVSRG